MSIVAMAASPLPTRAYLTLDCAALPGAPSIILASIELDETMGRHKSVDRRILARLASLLFRLGCDGCRRDPPWHPDLGRARCAPNTSHK